MKRVAIVVLNYCGWEDTIECLESLQTQSYPDFTVIVVDNGSPNESVEKILEWTKGALSFESEFVAYTSENKPLNTLTYTRQAVEEGGDSDQEHKLCSYDPCKRLVLIETGENLGFSGGNNVGSRYAVKQGYDYITLLNNDTIVTDRDFLKKIIQVFDTHQLCKVIGPKIINLDGSFDGPNIYESYWGEIFLLTIKNQFRRLLGCLEIYIDMQAIASAHPVPVYKISGACMVFESAFLHEIDYLDENVWLSCEEAIVAEKVLAKNMKIYFQPLTLLIHKKARSPRPKNSRIAILRNHFKQRRYFLKKYRKYGKFKMLPFYILHSSRILIEHIKN